MGRGGNKHLLENSLPEPSPVDEWQRAYKQADQALLAAADKLPTEWQINSNDPQVVAERLKEYQLYVKYKNQPEKLLRLSKSSNVMNNNHFIYKRVLAKYLEQESLPYLEKLEIPQAKQLTEAIIILRWQGNTSAKQIRRLAADYNLSQQQTEQILQIFT